MSTISALDLQAFYPEELKILNVENRKEEIKIYMHSVSKTCRCHRCGKILTEHHGSHHRTVQDLPILGKRVSLDMQIYDYECTCNEKGTYAPTETFDGFLSHNSRMTDRLEDFICMLALETSCESSAKIMNRLNVKVSGDTVIRILIKRYKNQPVPTCSNAVGIDDFAFKKRHTYGTIIVDEETHRPVAVLEGRDGKTLKEWLRQNQHVTTVTRDRASAYAKAVEEVLPDCMQIADRFHIHQNLMDAVNKVLCREIPASTVIPKNAVPPDPDQMELSTVLQVEGKKNRSHCG